MYDNFWDTPAWCVFSVFMWLISLVLLVYMYYNEELLYSLHPLLVAESDASPEPVYSYSLEPTTYYPDQDAIPYLYNITESDLNINTYNVTDSNIITDSTINTFNITGDNNEIMLNCDCNPREVT